MTDLLTFLPFSPEHADDFKALNIEWLEFFFVVEPIDELVLSKPMEQIIAPGGFIFMTALEQQVMGTFAFIKKENKTYEFSKMAIAPPFRGKGYGNQMMQFAIRFAEQHHWDKLLIYSSTLLENAICLYRKYGFVEVPMEANPIYSRGDIKMELELR